MITEHDGWTAGDNCYTVFVGESKASYCEIIEFHPGDDTTPAVSVTEVTTGKYRVAAMMAIAETAKEAKKIAPAWFERLKEVQAKKLKLERALRRTQAEAGRKLAAEEEEARKAAELEAEEAATRELKKKKTKK